MVKDIKIPEVISSRTEFKRKFSLGEMYRSFVFLPGAMLKMIGNNKNKLIDNDFVKRIQLTITQVNGCAACSYQHTIMALRQGMSNEEISSFLSGEDSYIKPEEAKGILFAQHFADSRGYPKEEAYDALVKEYDEEKARIILSAAQTMIAGNMYGIPYSAFLSRRKGKPFKDSTLFYEWGMMIAGVLVLPIALFHGLLRSLTGMPNKRLDKRSPDE